MFRLKLRRLSAYMFDRISITAALIGLSFLFPTTKLDIAMISYLISGMLLFVLYFVLIPYLKDGQTIGKLIMRIRVDSISGVGYITMAQLFKRELLKSFIVPFSIAISIMIPLITNGAMSGTSIAAIIYSFGDIMVWVIGWGVLFNPMGLAIHDRFANTMVREVK